MSNLSVEHLTKCIVEKDQYKFTQQYLKEVEMQNESVYDIVNDVLISMVTTNKFYPTAKLYALRFLKDLIISAQFQLIDSLHESIIKQIVKISQYDKENKQKLKRGSSYFQQAEKRNKQPDLQKISYSYVLLATQIIYVLGNWHAEDQNNQETDYAFIYKKLKNAKVPFPANDKELKFFKSEEKELFIKNYKDWIEKLPEIEEQSDEEDKSNLHESLKPIKQKQRVLPPQNSILQTKKSQKQQSSSANLIKDNKSDNSFRSELEKAMNENGTLQKRITDLQKNLQKADLQLKAQQKSSEQLKQKYSTLERKSSQLQSKCFLLETQFAESQKKLKESQSIAQKLYVENQQQKLFVKKVSMQRTDMEEKLSLSLKQSQNQLKQAQQKIGRLEREIQQIHTIKNSYKNIMDDPHKQIDQNSQSQQQKVKELEKQIQELAKFNTKEQSQYKDQIERLKHQNQLLQKEIVDKISLIENLQSQLNTKTQKISILEIKLQQQMNPLKSQSKKNSFDDKEIKEVKFSEIKKSTANFFNSQPQLKIPTQQKSPNSMSQYLFNQTAILKTTIESKENSYDTLKSRQSENYYSKGRNSLGKTEKSLEKRKQMMNRTSNGKTFHFSNVDSYKSNELNQNHLQKRPYLGLGRQNGNSSSSGELWSVTPKMIPQKDQQILSSKKSTLTLNVNRKRQIQDQSLTRLNAVQTLIPYIPSYFPQNPQINWFFKSLCLFTQARNKQPIFKNQAIQIRLLNDYKNKGGYVLGITNISYSSIKVQAVSCHEEFKIIGEKTRLIHPNSVSQYRLETKVKDLNLRYPVVSLIVSGTLNNKVANFTQNVSLPLTILEFTEMKEQIPQLCNLETQKLGVLQSQRFSLNQSYSSLKQCFPNLSFQNKLKPTAKTPKAMEQIWQGTLHHSFIENIDVYTKMIQQQTQVSLQFWFRSEDKISENYSKVMIQTLMFLLQ